MPKAIRKTLELNAGLVLLGKLELTSAQKYAANLDANNLIDSIDLLLLNRLILQ